MIVMKFGGSSVQDATAIRRVASIVALRLAEQPLVVVSAMGGVTDKLVQVAETAGRKDLGAAVALLEAIRARHVLAANDMLNPTAAAAFCEELDARIAEAAALARADRRAGIGFAGTALAHALIRRSALQRAGGSGLRRAWRSFGPRRRTKADRHRLPSSCRIASSFSHPRQTT